MRLFTIFKDFREWRKQKNATSSPPFTLPQPPSIPIYSQKEIDEHPEDYAKFYKDILEKRIDLHGETITNIYATTEDYVVYETEDKNPSLEVKVAIYTRIIDNVSILPRYNAVQPKYAIAKSLLHKVENPAITRARIASILDHALSQNENVVQALQSFDELIDEINEEFNDRIYNKLSFLFTNIAFSSIFAALTIWRFCIISHPATDSFYIRHHLDILTLLMCVLTCASIGGTLSLSIKLRNLAMARSVQRTTYFFYGLERLFIAATAGFIVFWAVSSGLIFPGIIKDPETLQGLSSLFLLSTAAGFSETLVPDLLVSMEKKSSDNTKSTT